MPLLADQSPDDAANASRVLEYEPKQQHLPDQLDAIFLHRFWGFVIFGAAMATLFITTFLLAQPLMRLIERLAAKAGRSLAGLLPLGPVRDLWTDGIVAGVGAVVVFTPHVVVLFMFLAVLEGTGYLSRSAKLMNPIGMRVGQHDRSLVPLLVLIGTFFGAYSALVQGGIMLALYALGIVAAAGTAWVFKRSFLKGPQPAFILEMPSYKLPQLSQVVRSVVTNTGAFLKKAGTIIFCLSVILWAMTYYPRLPEQQIAGIEKRYHAVRSTMVLGNIGESVYPYTPDEKAALDEALREFDLAKYTVHQFGPQSEDPEPDLSIEWAAHCDQLRDHALAAAQLRYSLAGRFGHLIEPVIKPLGYDWKMGVGLVGAFAAREVFVSTMGIVYSVGGDDENTEPLAARMQADRYPDGRPVWTPLVAVSLLVWFVLAMQCMSTLAIVRRETGGWTWPIGMLVYMNALAYVASLVVYQVGRIWWV